jgi:hypothetical protein
VKALTALAGEQGVPAFTAGTVGAPDTRLELRITGRMLTWDTIALRRIYYDAIPRRMAHAGQDR